jgi:chemotaxis protein MotB
MSSSRPPRRRRPTGDHEEHDAANHERWLLTYADMITLLMVLFIVLFAISVVDKKKFAALADGLSHQFGATNKILPAGTGVMDGGKTSNADQGQLTNNPAQPLSPLDQVEVSQQRSQDQQKQNLLKQEQAALADARQQIEAALKARGLQNSVSFKVTSRGLVVSIVTDQVLFDTGQASLKPVGHEVLDAVAPALRNLPNDISIEGHTDNVPINGGLFASNWELSAVRATTVLRYLVANEGLRANRLSATGYADTKPVVLNDSPAHQAQNRRVEVVVLSSLLAGSVPPAAPMAPVAPAALDASHSGGA